MGVESELGQGSTFTFTLPIDQAALNNNFSVELPAFDPLLELA
jgi:hypothetical protein